MTKDIRLMNTSMDIAIGRRWITGINIILQRDIIKTLIRGIILGTMTIIKTIVMIPKIIIASIFLILGNTKKRNVIMRLRKTSFSILGALRLSFTSVPKYL